MDDMNKPVDDQVQDAPADVTADVSVDDQASADVPAADVPAEEPVAEEPAADAPAEEEETPAGYGCSMSQYNSPGNILDFCLPYVIMALMLGLFKLRDLQTRNT